VTAAGPSANLRPVIDVVHNYCGTQYVMVEEAPG
jgi:hypothetical protein